MMLAAAEARTLTSAEGPSASRTCDVLVDSYVSADTNRPNALVFPGPRMQLQTEILAGARRYLLRDLFVVNVSYLEDNKVFADHSTLPIHGYGESLEGAINAFCEAFDFQWRNLVEVSEASLTPGGKRRRAALKAAVKDVVELDT